MEYFYRKVQIAEMTKRILAAMAKNGKVGITYSNFL